MTMQHRSSAELQTILVDLARGPYPEYIDNVLARTARTRQRPAWTFAERWLSMFGIAREPALPRRFPWRAIAIALIVIALLVAAVVALIAGAQPRIPAPFGVAHNGLVAFERDGDIYTADPATGVERAILTGSQRDVGPRFSFDGTRILFERKVDYVRSQVYLAKSDGTGITLLTPEPLTLVAGDVGRAWEKYQLSPDGQTVLIATQTAGVPSITLARADGTGARRLELDMSASEPSFRPPRGAEILFISHGLEGFGLFAVNIATEKVRPIQLIPNGHGLAGASWSPDGSHIAYWMWDESADGQTARTHVVAADGTGDRELPSPPGAIWNAHATWSNDGKRIFIARAYTSGFDDVRGAVLPADGSDFGVEVAPAGVETNCCAAWMWSPDDSKLLGRTSPIGGTPQKLVIIDLATKTVSSVPWTSTSDPTWQRLPP
jgi:hypothetical protein